MIRSIWKPIYIHSQVAEDFSMVSSEAIEINTQNRAIAVSMSRLGQRFQIYNGIRWFSIVIIPEKFGHLLGEFAPTRKRPIPKKKKIIKKK